MGDGVNIAAESREKVFGLGRPRALDRNAKVQIMHWARCLSRRTEKGRGGCEGAVYGAITALQFEAATCNPSVTVALCGLNDVRSDGRGSECVLRLTYQVELTYDLVKHTSRRRGRPSRGGLRSLLRALVSGKPAAQQSRPMA